VCGLLALFAVRSPIACCCFQAHIWRLQFCAQQELVILCFVFCLFWHCTLVYFGLFSSLNLVMRSSPARLKKSYGLERRFRDNRSQDICKGN
jgi:hypothetical protein